MARKKTISAESIINTGLKVIREHGIEALNARHLAEEMSVTTTPIFTNFGSMDNLIFAIWKKAKQDYDDYLAQSLKSPVVFKEFGLRFLDLAIEDSNIFKFVFMPTFLSEEQNHLQRLEFNQTLKPVFEAIRNPFNLSEDGVSELIHILITFTAGIAVIHMRSGTKPDKVAYSIMLSHLFDASCEYITKHKDQVSKEAFEKLLNEQRSCLNSDQETCS